MTNGPLHGIRVVEAGRFITAPYASMLLADLGAEVIKIESPDGGDPFRNAGPGVSARFLAYNRGKRSVALDVRTDEGKAALLQIFATADVYIENFRPGVMARLGLDYASVKDACPQLVYCSITGAGDSGPLATVPMYDAIGQGLSGLMSQFSAPEQPQPLGPALSDSITGLMAAYGIQAALLERTRTGRGQRVETSMLAATISFLAEPAAHYFTTGVPQDTLTRPRQSQSYGFLASDDKPLVIHLSSPEKFWFRLLEATDRLDLQDDPRFNNYQNRVDGYHEIHAELKPVLATRDRAHWLTRFAEVDLPAGPVLGTGEVFDHPQVRELQVEETLDGGEKVAGRGVRLESLSSEMASPPVFAADTDRVLSEIGYSPDDIERLRDQGVIA